MPCFVVTAKNALVTGVLVPEITVGLSSQQICAGNVRQEMQMQQKLLCIQPADSSH